MSGISGHVYRAKWRIGPQHSVTNQLCWPQLQLFLYLFCCPPPCCPSSTTPPPFFFLVPTSLQSYYSHCHILSLKYTNELPSSPFDILAMVFHFCYLELQYFSVGDCASTVYERSNHKESIKV